jgi:hypothetical protein
MAERDQYFLGYRRAEAAYDELKDTLKRHLDDPETLVVFGPYFQAWGRKPARGDAR